MRILHISVIYFWKQYFISLILPFENLMGSTDVKMFLLIDYDKTSSMEGRSFQKHCSSGHSFF